MIMGRVDIRIDDNNKEKWILSAQEMRLSLTDFVHTAVENMISKESFVHTNKEKADMKDVSSVHTGIDSLVKNGLITKGVKSLPIQEEGEFKSYLKERKKPFKKPKV